MRLFEGRVAKRRISVCHEYHDGGHDNVSVRTRWPHVRHADSVVQIGDTQYDPGRERKEHVMADTRERLRGM